MTMLEIHTAASSSKVASYHEFLTRYSKDSKTVYGFVEGKEDPCFYRGFIDLMLPEEWEVELWPAGNKDEVYRIHADLDWKRFPRTRICFFVDRDIADIIPEKLTEASNIFVTVGYSIENDLVKKGTCRRVLSELCGLSYADHARLEGLCVMFEREYELFLKALVPVMAWVLCWRRIGKRPNLNEIAMRDLFEIQNGCLLVKAMPKGKSSVSEYLHQRCNVSFDPTIEIGVYEAEIKRGGLYKRLTRGKFAFWFLVEFCITVHRDIAKLIEEIPKPPKMHVALSCANGVALIGPRARIPTSLRDFLRATYCTYIGRCERKAA